jgi:hypothetical protein
MALFLRDDVAKGHFSETSAEEAYFPDSRTSKVLSEKKQIEIVGNLDFVSV